MVGPSSFVMGLDGDRFRIQIMPMNVCVLCVLCFVIVALLNSIQLVFPKPEKLKTPSPELKCNKKFKS